MFFIFIGNHHTTAGNHRSSGILPHVFRVIRVSVDQALGKSPAPKLSTTSLFLIINMNIITFLVFQHKGSSVTCRPVVTLRFSGLLLFCFSKFFDWLR